jgi:hypothetical protein
MCRIHGLRWLGIIGSPLPRHWRIAVEQYRGDTYGIPFDWRYDTLIKIELGSRLSLLDDWIAA